MFLGSFYFIENLDKNIIYNESNKIYICSKLSRGLLKVHYDYIYFFYNFFFFFRDLFYMNKKNTYLLNNIKKNIEIYMFGKKKRYRMVGRGFYLYSKNNVLYFRLGFSHVIKYVLPLNIIVGKKKRKKKKFTTIIGYDYENIISIVNTIRSFRGPNLYSKRIKGISLSNEFIPRGIRSFSKF